MTKLTKENATKEITNKKVIDRLVKQGWQTETVEAPKLSKGAKNV